MGKPKKPAIEGTAAKPAQVTTRKVAYGLADLPEGMRREVERRAGGDLRRITVLGPGRAEITP